MYADTRSESMEEAIEETSRRREIQESYNKEHGIIPETIKKEIRDLITNNETKETKKKDKMSKQDKKQLIQNIEKEMKKAASELDFERAMELRDIMFELSTED